MNDNQHLKSAKGRFGHPIPAYDDGWGNLYILRDSMGIQGIARAQTWEDAYHIAEDEFFPEASETTDQLRAEYGEEFWDHECFQEAYGFRPNGPNVKDTHKHGIYAKDLNGEALDQLTPELIAQLEITLEIETDPEEPQE